MRTAISPPRPLARELAQLRPQRGVVLRDDRFVSLS
jgi:hypothetical protein